MNGTFEPAGYGAGYVTRLDVAERVVLLDLVDDVIELLGGSAVVDADPAGERNPLDDVRLGAPRVTPPHDPAVRRLLPDASREDPEVAAEFRRLTETDLRTTKVGNLLRLRAAVDAARPDLLVVPSEAAQVAAALNDLRLVLSERLGVRSDADADALYRLATQEQPETAGDPDEDRQGASPPAEALPGTVTDPDARRFLATVYVVLGILQESLIELMLDELPDAPPDA